MPVQGADRRTPLQSLLQVEMTAEELVGGAVKEDRKREESIHRPDPFADERCTRPILDFLRETMVGARVGPQGLPPESKKVKEDRGGK